VGVLRTLLKRTGDKYDGPGIPELRTKLALGVTFDQLDQTERELLLKAWYKCGRAREPLGPSPTFSKH
jgi:hypothetical protein